MTEDDAKKRARDLIDGWECAALAEDAVETRFADETAAFLAHRVGDVEPFRYNIRHIRVAQEASSNAKRFRLDAKALTMLLEAADAVRVA